MIKKIIWNCLLLNRIQFSSRLFNLNLQNLYPITHAYIILPRTPDVCTSTHAIKEMDQLLVPENPGWHGLPGNPCLDCFETPGWTAREPRLGYLEGD